MKKIIKIAFLNIIAFMLVFSQNTYSHTTNIKSFQWGVSISGYQHEGYDTHSI